LRNFRSEKLFAESFGTREARKIEPWYELSFQNVYWVFYELFKFSTSNFFTEFYQKSFRIGAFNEKSLYQNIPKKTPNPPLSLYKSIQRSKKKLL
jgi:hypothetical protein